MRKQEASKMQTQKLVPPKVLVQTQREGNFPEKKFRAGAVSATIWQNKSQSKEGEEVEYQTISLDRNYKDKAGQWQTTNSFRVNDLPKAVVVMQKAYEYLVLKEQELFRGE